MDDAEKIKLIKFYPPFEEKLNIYSHALACIASVIGLCFMLAKAWELSSWLHAAAFSIYCLSMVVLYACSTAYHAAKDPLSRLRLKVFDHAAIYIFIAGSYTPFTLIALEGQIGWIMFGITWGMAAIGVTLKLFFTGRYKLLSTLMYVVMGWAILPVLEPLQATVPNEGIQLLAAGGISYTVGAVIYSIKKIPLNHAIFHILVVLGTVLQFFSVYGYI
ncbi:MAG: hemolysin III family protein [Pseudomonadales bacterium]|nr:hemolysin III family protein [Pseudomonadales bacterium]